MPMTRLIVKNDPVVGVGVGVGVVPGPVVGSTGGGVGVTSGMKYVSVIVFFIITDPSTGSMQNFNE